MSQQYVLAPIQLVWTPPHIGRSCTVNVGEHPRADWACAQPIAPVRLSAKQRKIYDFIRSYQQTWGATPLYREIGVHCGIGETTVQHHVQQLMKLGLVRKPRGLVRAIRVTHIAVKLN